MTHEEQPRPVRHKPFIRTNGGYLAGAPAPSTTANSAPAAPARLGTQTAGGSVGERPVQPGRTERALLTEHEGTCEQDAERADWYSVGRIVGFCRVSADLIGVKADEEQIGLGEVVS